MVVFKKKLKLFFFNIRSILRQYCRMEPRFKINSHFKLKKIGSDYGGWNYLETNSLKNSTIISAGVGEDISFDIELLNLYNLKIILIDPTPRSFIHIDKVLKNIGKSKKQDYTNDGNQPIDSYELKNIKKNQLIYLKFALWNKTEQIKFFKPQNKENVSHSVNNYFNNYSTNDDFITVDAIRIVQVINKYNLKNIEMLKLDIEGAEIEVLDDMLKSNIYPKQILVEFDELSKPNPYGKKRVEYINLLLLKNNYSLINRDRNNFTYFRII